MIRTVLMAAVVCAAPAHAQTASPTTAATEAPLDPARLAAARPVVDRVWPLGTYKRIMSTTMDRMMDSIMGAAFDMKASEIARSAGDEKGAEAAGDKTLGETAREADPAFDERMRITMRVMNAEMGALMTRIEPDVREALARIMAKRFTAAELGELARFFATPAGAKYAGESLVLAADPEMIASTMKFMPVFMEAMPAIQKKVEDATKHLPPPPKPKGDTAEEATE